MNSSEIKEKINSNKGAVKERKLELKDKDYVGHKILDAMAGVLSQPSPTIGKLATAVQGVLEQYPDYLSSRQQQRTEINDRQSTIEELSQMTPDEELLDE